MSVKSCEKVEKSQVALTIEVGAPEFEAAIEKAYQKMRKKINVQGFRPGKAPRKIIEGMYGVEVFFEEAINIAFPDAYEAAVKEQDLRVVGYPEVEMVGECTRDGFTFKATVPVYPEVTLGQYKGLSAEKDEVKVMAADVNERLKELTDRNTRLVSVDRAAKEGDTAVIDFEGFLDGKPFDGGKGENHSLELGSHSFVPGFEDQLVGMKAGEEKDIDITFPENYHADLAGKPVVFHVKINEVKEKKVPTVDDEFAKDVSEFETLADFKADLSKKLTERREKQAQDDFENALLEQVVANMEVEIPDAMVDYRADQMMDDYARRITSQGIPFENYLQMMGMTKESMREQAKDGALHQIQVELALDAVAAAESIEISDEEKEAEYSRLAEQYGMKVEQVKAAVAESDLVNELKTKKAAEVVYSNGKAGEAKKAEAEGEEKPKKKAAPRKKAAKKAEAEEPKAEGEELKAEGEEPKTEE